MAPASRRHHATLSEEAPAGGEAAERAALEAARDEARRRVLAGTSGSDGGVYVGAAGEAFALCAAGDDGSLAAVPGRFAAAERDARLRRRGSAASVLCGAAGLHLVGALLRLPPHGGRPHAEAFRALLGAALESDADEVLYGRAGYLLGLLQLKRAALLEDADAAVAAVAEAVLESGRRGASGARDGPPLWWEWHGEPYVGAAHGFMGILYALLRAGPTALGRRGVDEVAATIRYVLTLEERPGEYPTCAGDGRHHKTLVHWCHGSPGAVFLFSAAAEFARQHDRALGNPDELLAACVRAAEATWEAGLVRKGPGLCHGVSGNAYALLCAARATGDPRWSKRATRFAAHLDTPQGRGDLDTPDHPSSLFEGCGGALVLLSQLLGPDPTSARFPMFET